MKRVSSMCAPLRTAPVRRTPRSSTRFKVASEASVFAQLPASITVSRIDARRSVAPDRSTFSIRLSISSRPAASRPRSSEPTRCCSRSSTPLSSAGARRPNDRTSGRSGAEGCRGWSGLERRRAVTRGGYAQASPANHGRIVTARGTGIGPVWFR